MPRLTITGGALAGQQFSFTESAIVGRGAYSDIRIDDATVSRRHAEITCGSDGKWRVRDLGSANGTLHGDKAISGELIVDGSVDIVIGEVPVHLSTEEVQDKSSTGRRTFPQLLDRLELLAWIAALSARREDPAQLLGQALDALLKGFAGCTRVGLFVTRSDGASLMPYARRSGDNNEDWQSSADLAQACLRHVDGLVGSCAAMAPLGVAVTPAGIFAAPLIFAGETLGALLAESNQADTWTPLDRPIAKAIASVLAGLLDAVRSSSPERRVAERDLALARRVQQHFLPQSTVRLPGYQVAEAYAPARAVGGDHYDFFRFSDDRIGMVIADVSGKAVSAALVMARFGMGVRLLASQTSNPLDLLVTLNVLLLDELEAGMFVTAQIIAITPESGKIDIANAGHPSPLLRSAGGAVEVLTLDPGAALGADAKTNFRTTTVTLEPGACLMFYSDGLDEAENEANEQFGIERAKVVMAGAIDAPTVLASIKQALSRFVGAANATDDLTLLLVSRDGSASQV